MLSLERLNRILEIDEQNLLAVVEPNVITGDLQDAVEHVGLFYPPDPGEPAAVGRSAATSPSAPADRARSSTARRSGTCSASRRCCRPARSIRDRRQGREERRRLRPDAAARRLGGHAGDHHEDHPAARAEAAGQVDAARDVPGRGARGRRRHRADRAARRAGGPRADRRRVLEAVARYLGRARWRRRAPARCCCSRWTAARGGRRGRARVEAACRAAGATEVLRADDDAKREELWRVRRELSLSLKMIARARSSTTTSSCRRGAIPELFAAGGRAPAQRSAITHSVLRARRRRQHPREHHGRSRRRGRGRRAPARPSARCSSASSRSRARSAASTASASRRRRSCAIELSPDEIALMKRVKRAFDPAGILNPGKIFPE